MNDNTLKLSLVLFVVGCVCSVDGRCNLQLCTDRSICTVSRDKRSCKCVQGFYGDGCDQSAHIQVLCGRDSISIRALESYFTYYKVPLESLHLPNKSCRAESEMINGVSYYTAKVTKDNYLLCGGKPLEKNLTHIAYSITLRSNPRVSGNIIRQPLIKLDFKCVFPYIRKVSLKYPVRPFVSSETVMRSDELEATIQIALYTDHSYSRAYTFAPTIELGEEVYVEVMVTEPADYFLLRINECWATQSPQSNSTEGYVHSLLHNGCAQDETVKFLNESNADFRNGVGSTVRYSFDMFQFTSEPYDIYLHCVVQICEPEDHRSCTPNCKSISKREALLTDSDGILSYGPIQLQVSEKVQSNVLTTVVLPVASVWVIGLFVVVLIVVAKAASHRVSSRGQTQ